MNRSARMVELGRKKFEDQQNRAKKDKVVSKQMPTAAGKSKVKKDNLKEDEKNLVGEDEPRVKRICKPSLKFILANIDDPKKK